MLCHSLFIKVLKLLIFLQLIQKVLPKERIVMHWQCDCRDHIENSSGEFTYYTLCHSHGVDLKHITDSDKDNGTLFWSFSKGAFIEIVSKCFVQHNKTLKEISVTKLKHLDEFGRQAFNNLLNLEAITVSGVPALRFLPLGVFSSLKNLKVLRITHTGLESLPTLLGLSRNIMNILDFESNKIKIIKSNSLCLQTEQLILDYNSITKIEGWAFNGSQIGKLSLKGNHGLTELYHDSFGGLNSLRDLDLSETSITFLPVIGLESLETLVLVGTNTLKIIPSIHDLKSLRMARLTYSFHCCAFQYPARHDPVRHELHEEYLARVKELCHDKSHETKLLPTSEMRNTVQRSKRDHFGPIMITNTASIVSWSDSDGELHDRNSKPVGVNSNQQFGSLPHNNNYGQQGWSDIKLDYPVATPADTSVWDKTGVFHETVPPIEPSSKFNILCGNLSIRREPVKCYPEPDALNPCEDIMGYKWLRICVWLVICTALFGNTLVLIVLIANHSNTNVARFLILNLAFSDLLMTVYLLLLALSDLQSTGVYFNYAYDWQRGYGCKLAGVLTVFSSQLSVYTLSLITIERWYAIRHALHTNKFNLKVACYAMAFGWSYSITMAVLPLFGISSYSTTSICLPMAIQTVTSTIYVISLLGVTGFAFILICVCYVQIYMSLGKETRHPPGEGSIARKMMLLVGTNFACWGPIAFFSLTAVAGYPLIDVTRSKILLVFFYPINSCANPYLYAILTAQYRKQLVQLLSKCGICTECAQQYKLVYSPTTREMVKHSKDNERRTQKKSITISSRSPVTTEEAL